MPIQVRAPDGSIAQFPDGTPDATITQVMARTYGAPKKLNPVAGFMANVNRGLGIGDEMAAGAKTAINALTGKVALTDIPADFQRSMADQRQLEDGYSSAQPAAAALARGTGNALTMAAPIGPGAEAFAAPLSIAGRTVAPVVANAARGATLAGLTGAGYAAVDRGTAGQRLRAAARTATDPVVLGLGAAGGALATPRAAKPQAEPAPTLDELTSQKNAAYQAVRDSGVTYTPEAYDQLTHDITQAVGDARFNPKLHPKAAAILDYLHGLGDVPGGYAPSLDDLDQIRQVIGRDVASSPDAGERRMGAIMRGQIDQFMQNAGPDHLVSGEPDQAASLLGTARDLNTRVEKLRALDNLDEKAADRASATGSGGNRGNATRQNVIRFKNQVDNLTPDEEAATQKVIDGTPIGNALRNVGKLSPQGNGLMLAGHLAAAVPTGGKSAVVALTGAVSKALSDAMTAGNVQALREIIANGGQAAAEVTRQLADPQYAELKAQLANDMAAQAGVQGASMRAAGASSR